MRLAPQRRSERVFIAVAAAVIIGIEQHVQCPAACLGLVERIHISKAHLREVGQYNVMLEEQAQWLASRVRELTPERQKSALDYAARLTEHARAQLEELIEQHALQESIEATPHPAD